MTDPNELDLEELKWHAEAQKEAAMNLYHRAIDDNVATDTLGCLYHATRAIDYRLKVLIKLLEEKK